MFYVGLIVAFIGGVLGVGIIRRPLQAALGVNEGTLNAVRLTLVVGGLLLAAYSRHSTTIAESEREDPRPYAMRSPMGRIQKEEQGMASTAGGEIEQLMFQALSGQGDQFSPRCDGSGEDATKKLVEGYPGFPHGWWLRAACRRTRMDDGWKDDAKECVRLTGKILEMQPHAAWYSQLEKFCTDMLSE